MKNIIYADNAATTQLDIEAFEAMKPFMLENYGNASQPYSFSRVAKLALKKARQTIAECINADPDEIFFTSGGTESNNWVVKCFGFPTDIKHIITTNIEHHSILNACKVVNAEIIYLEADKDGFVHPEDLEAILSREREAVATCETTLVSVMFANNEIGTIQPIKELAAVAHKYGAIFHTDAVQAVGHIKIDVKELGIDLLSASAHKFNGAKGVGFLYNGAGDFLYPLHDGGAQEYGKRAGTENVAAIVGMAIALENNVASLDTNASHIEECVAAFYEELNASKIDYIINGNGIKIPGNINISFKGKNGEAIMHLLDLKKIIISTGSACDSVNNQVSHVIKAIGVSGDYAEGTIRITFGKRNTVDEARTVAKTLVGVLKL